MPTHFKQLSKAAQAIFFGQVASLLTLSARLLLCLLAGDTKCILGGEVVVLSTCMQSCILFWQHGCSLASLLVISSAFSLAS